MSLVVKLAPPVPGSATSVGPLASLPMLRPRSSASFLSSSSSIGENASSARTLVAQNSRTQKTQGNHHSELPLDSLDSVRRSDWTRSLKDPGADLLPVS